MGGERVMERQENDGGYAVGGIGQVGVYRLSTKVEKRLVSFGRFLDSLTMSPPFMLTREP